VKLLSRLLAAGSPALIGAAAVLLPVPAGVEHAMPPPPITEETYASVVLASLERESDPERQLEPAAQLEASPPAPPPEPPAPPAEPDPCADALARVEEAGLVLPEGVDFDCPSTQFAHHGAACWDEYPCPGRAMIAVNLGLIGDRPADYLRYVVAHEICHILDFQAGRRTSEAGAHACALAHGAEG